MLISVITVVKNDLTRLKKTISSLQEFYQNHNFEHIIIDGKSKDNTCHFVRQLKVSSKNLIYKSANDYGIYDAMNKGIDLCRGSFVLFLNAGDELIIDKIALINKLKEFYNVNIDVLCFPFHHDFKGRIIHRNAMQKNRDKLPTSHQAMFFSKEFIKKNNYDLVYKISADFDLYQKAERSKVFLLSNSEPLCKVESEGVASTNPYLSYIEYIKIVIFHYQGLTRLYLINKIFLKFCIIMFLNLFISKSFILKIREKFYYM
jgi:glycosyltransferase involved in cell wall biosynthesis